MMHRTKGPSADKQFTKMSKGLGLCIVYADNIGGIVTPTGTPPNLVLKSQADSWISVDNIVDERGPYECWNKKGWTGRDERVQTRFLQTLYSKVKETWGTLQRLLLKSLGDSSLGNILLLKVQWDSIHALRANLQWPSRLKTRLTRCSSMIKEIQNVLYGLLFKNQWGQRRLETLRQLFKD